MLIGGTPLGRLGIVATAIAIATAVPQSVDAEDLDLFSDNELVAQTTTVLPDVIVTGRSATPIGVTGSRLGVPVDDIPATIEILDQETMRARGDRTNQEAVEKTVGWSSGYSPGNGVVFSARGFSLNDIAQLHDGIRVSNPTMSSRRFDTFTYDRIEVLNGPASVLHGEGAISGAVNYISKEPDPERRESEALLSYGAFNTARTAYGTGGPIGDSKKAAYRFDGILAYSDGFVDEASYERYHLNGAVRVDASDDLVLTLRGEAFADDSVSYNGIPLSNGKVDERLRDKNYNVSDNQTWADQLSVRLEADFRIADTFGIENQLYAFNANRIWRNAEAYQFDSNTNLVQITGLGDVRHEQYLIGDRFQGLTTEPIFDHDNRFAAGFDISTNHFRRNANFPGVAFFVDAFSPETPTFNTLNGNAPLNPGATTVINTYGLFFEEQFEIVDGLKFVGGLRADLLDLDVDNHTTGAQDRRFFFAPTSRVGIVYNVSPKTTLYGHYSNAENPPAPFVLGRALTFDLEQSIEIEFGVRQRLWNDRIEATVAVYDLVKKNILTQVPGNPNATQNIGEQSSRGIEVSLSAEPLADWRVGGNGSLLSAEFDKFNSGGASLAGNLPPNVPEQLGNIWTSYRFQNGLEVGASLRYVGQRSGNNINSFGLPSYTLVDAHVSYAFGAFDLTIRGRNLSDELALTYSETDFSQQVQLGEPLSVEARLTARF